MVYNLLFNNLKILCINKKDYENGKTEIKYLTYLLNINLDLEVIELYKFIKI